MGNVSKSQTKVQEKKGRTIASESGFKYLDYYFVFIMQGGNIMKNQLDQSRKQVCFSFNCAKLRLK